MLLVSWVISDAWAGGFIERPTSIVERLVSLMGVFLFAGLCYLMSENRQKVDWKLIAWGIGLQFALCSVVLLPGVSKVLPLLGDAVQKLLSFASEGANFVFASFGGPNAHTFTMADGTAKTVGGGMISPPLVNFAFTVLPTIVFFSALSSLLYRLGVLQVFVRVIAFLMQKTMGTSGAETLCTAANIFLGQTEAPLLIKPFIARLTRSELMVVMVGGMATIAVGVLGAYSGFLAAIPNAGGHLIIASVISAPATFVCAKLMVPETHLAETSGAADIQLPKGDENPLLSIAIGAGDGLRLALNVAAMLIAVVALTAMVNFAIGYVPVTFCDQAGLTAGYHCPTAADVPHALDLSRILGWVFFPVGLMMGVPWSEAGLVGRLCGEKLVLTEFVAYLDLSAAMNGPVPQLTQRSAIIAAYALCGFANFASIGIQVGGIGALAEDRKKDLAELGFRAMVAGTIATCMTGAVVGVFV